MNENGIWRAVGNGLGRALDGTLPPICPVTEDRVTTQGMLSPKAWGSIQFITPPYCVRCAVPFAMDYGDGSVCPSCIAEPPAFDEARAAVVYDEASRRLIVPFKHSDKTELAPLLAAWLSRATQDLPMDGAIVMATPLHWRRLLERRFNQSDLLARTFARHNRAAYLSNGLRRIRQTRTQDGLSADARRRNVAGAFRVNDHAKAAIDDAHIVLIDDVFTTGATLSACSRALKRAGAARVSAVVLGRVVKSGQRAI